MKYLPSVEIWVLAIILLILIERFSVPPYQRDRYRNMHPDLGSGNGNRVKSLMVIRCIGLFDNNSIPVISVSNMV